MQRWMFLLCAIVMASPMTARSSNTMSNPNIEVAITTSHYSLEDAVNRRGQEMIDISLPGRVFAVSGVHESDVEETDVEISVVGDSPTIQLDGYDIVIPRNYPQSGFATKWAYIADDVMGVEGFDSDGKLLFAMVQTLKPVFDPSIAEDFYGPEMDVDCLDVAWPFRAGEDWELTGGYGHCRSCSNPYAVDLNRRWPNSNDCGAFILNPGYGNVYTIGWDAYGYGNYIDITHQRTWSRTAHMQESSWNYTAPGHTLLAGTGVGHCGTTGNSSGCHIHFELFDRASGRGITPEGVLAPSPLTCYRIINLNWRYSGRYSYVRPPWGNL